jgi:hypothetical protein
LRGSVRFQGEIQRKKRTIRCLRILCNILTRKRPGRWQRKSVITTFPPSMTSLSTWKTLPCPGSSGSLILHSVLRHFFLSTTPIPHHRICTRALLPPQTLYRIRHIAIRCPWHGHQAPATTISEGIAQTRHNLCTGKAEGLLEYHPGATRFSSSSVFLSASSLKNRDDRCDKHIQKSGSAGQCAMADRTACDCLSVWKHDLSSGQRISRAGYLS